MKPSLTDTLCTTCGLCCDGSLFADVELSGTDETSRLEVLGLEIEDAAEDHHGLLLQPCRALKGTRCSVYAHRPECCRTFECHLLQEVRRGAVTADQAKQKIVDALQRIARITLLVDSLGRSDQGLPLRERCAEALTLPENGDRDPDVHRMRDELEAAMASLERLIQETFLVG